MPIDLDPAAFDAMVGRALDGLPDDPASLPSEPALSDVAFAARLDGTVAALPTLTEPASN